MVILVMKRERVTVPELLLAKTIPVLAMAWHPETAAQNPWR